MKMDVVGSTLRHCQPRSMRPDPTSITSTRLEQRAPELLGWLNSNNILTHCISTSSSDHDRGRENPAALLKFKGTISSQRLASLKIKTCKLPSIT